MNSLSAGVGRRCLTPRWRRGPTALHLAREAPWFIMRLAGQAQYRRSRLNSNVRPRKVHPSLSMRALVTLLALWLLTCVAAYFATSDLGFHLTYFVLPASALFVPLAVGHAAYKFSRGAGESRSTPGKAVELAALALAVLSYVACIVVLNRILELPWHHVKFGDSVLSLGRSAAQFFALVALSLSAAAAIVWRNCPSKSRPRAFCSSALAMLGFACFAYAAIGASPLTEWRP
jgi:hypothetical protein